MTDFYMPRKNGQGGGLGFDFKDDRGHRFRYDANRDGRIVVDNPEHVKVIEQAAHNDGGYIQKSVGGAQFHRTPSKHCTGCRFVAYRWQTACPKCGGKLEVGEK